MKVTIDHIPLRAPRYPKAFYEQVPQSRFIHCNQTRADDFHNQYGVAETKEATQFKQYAAELLAEASEVLSKLGVRFWISSGTCLGEWK